MTSAQPYSPRNCYRYGNPCRRVARYPQTHHTPANLPAPSFREVVSGGSETLGRRLGLLLRRGALRRDLCGHERCHRLVGFEVQIAATLAATRSVLTWHWCSHPLIGDKRAIHQLPRGTATHHALDVEDLNKPGNPYSHLALPRHNRVCGASARCVPGRVV